MIFIVNTLFTAAWMALIWRFDEFSHLKKSRKTLALFMLAGMASMILVALGYYFSPIELISNNDDIESVFITHMLIAGPYEEGAKFLMFLFITRHFAPIKEPRDGILYAAAVAVGYSAVENYAYGGLYGLENLLIRSALCTTGHIIYAAIWGYFYALVVYEGVRRRGRIDYRPVFLSLVPAAFVHGLYNVLVHTVSLPVGVGLILAVTFIALRLLKSYGKHSPYRKFYLSQYQEAVNAYRKALGVDPNNPVINKRIALFYLHGGRYSESLDHLERSIKADPDNTYVRCLRGAVLLLSGETVKGNAAFQRGLGRLHDPQREILRKNLKCTIRNDSQRDEVLAALNQAAEIGKAYRKKYLELNLKKSCMEIVAVRERW